MRLHKIASDGITKNLRQELRNGQIVRGEILKIYPNQKAQIKLSNQQLIAKLEASLVIGNKYHFQVNKSNNTIYLKVIGEKLKNQPKQDYSNLLRQLGMKSTKTNVSLIHKLMSEGIAFNKMQLTSALPILDAAKDKKVAQEVLQVMFRRKLPMNEAIFKALYIENISDQSSLMRQLLQQIENDPKYMNLSHELNRFVEISQIDKEQELLLLQANPKEQFIQQLNRYMKLMDFSNENRLLNNHINQQETFKNMLVQLVSTGSGSIQEQGEKLLHFINGIQLNSITETDNFIQAFLNIPGERLALKKDLELEFKSKKSEDGKINPDYCRVLFYLDLNTLNETIIDMNIKQRAIFVTIFNDNESLQAKTITLLPSLKKGLEGISYTLSSIQFKSVKEQREVKNSPIETKSNAVYQGVDFRI
ncbi:hypothetical protein [Oceanobacillus bengalensis]|uniref:Flagellar hook-length control protein FliK n=1 Tax=Oceanobacillus bengalensis TaxID=1435466 RepID=A0A494Z4F9_9BACI|nr:hypothetical protein [Oceanobacillus bengalensis]RKQ17387.1 hypothetical protein D8M05_04985 [Oceanobacillus bengalensis]